LCPEMQQKLRMQIFVQLFAFLSTPTVGRTWSNCSALKLITDIHDESNELLFCEGIYKLMTTIILIVLALLLRNWQNGGLQSVVTSSIGNLVDITSSRPYPASSSKCKGEKHECWS
jgi:hypothetical protein